MERSKLIVRVRDVGLDLMASAALIYLAALLATDGNFSHDASQPNKNRTASSLAAFTLIELSIVLVIIGLIVGGVLVGQDLIRAAAVRAQITQIEKYNTAVNTFYGKYGYLPGDIPDPVATQNGFAARGTLQGEGDGNGIIEGIITYSTPYPIGNVPWGEPMGFWLDLSRASLIDSAFNTATLTSMADGVTSSSTPNIGAFLPEAKLGGGNYINVYSANGFNYFGVSGILYLATGAIYSAGPGTGWTGGLTVSQAYAIDKKIDDGFPLSGRVTPIRVNGFTCWSSDGCVTDVGNPVSPSSATCFDNGGNASAPMTYSISQNNGAGVNCALSFQFQ